MKKSLEFSPEFRDCAVRMVTECRAGHPSLWSAVESIADNSLLSKTANDYIRT